MAAGRLLQLEIAPDTVSRSHRCSVTAPPALKLPRTRSWTQTWVPQPLLPWMLPIDTVFAVETVALFDTAG